jgi:hypothetical protein
MGKIGRGLPATLSKSVGKEEREYLRLKGSGRSVWRNKDITS